MARIRKGEERITLQLLEGSAGREGKRSNSQDSKLTEKTGRAARERPQLAPGLASLKLSDFQSADLLQGEEGEPSSADFGSSERLGSWREEDVRQNAGMPWDWVGRRPTKRLPRWGTGSDALVGV